ncbi:MAG TPA: aminotransferase class III-fold pyridoxal phosphate-dependent enzyme, partial [Myxococcota bacterium]|nr:aminotransferase class III-fold pyridoxal phosphate-dependent enzyme [Myxococcota bacterium]
VFDEVVTGLRVHLGGAQAALGVRADLAAYGGVLGGGMPIGAIAGTAALMGALDGNPWPFADSAFARHPLALAAARAVLQRLIQQGPRLHDAWNTQTARMAGELNAHFASLGVPLKIEHFGSMWRPSYTEAQACGDLLFPMLRARGLHIWEELPCFVTTAYTDADIEFVVDAFKGAVRDMLEAGFLSQRQAPAVHVTAPSSEPQRELWISTRLGDDASCAFNLTFSVTLTGSLDAAALGRAVNTLVERHEALRTTFTPDGMGLVVHPVVSLPVSVVRLDGPEALARLERREVETPFSLEQGPLFRAHICQLDVRTHVIVMTGHHIVCDGWSIGVLLRELAALYTAYSANTAVALPTAQAFSVYARSQEVASPEAARALAYWQRQFETVPPPLELPTDRPRPGFKTYRSARIDRVLGPALVEAVKKAGAQAGCSFFTTLLAAFDVLLFKLSGQDDLVVGIPAAGQPVAGQDNLVGHCVNTLPVRTRVHGSMAFSELLRALRPAVLEAYENQQCTFGSLLKTLPIRRDPARLPLVSVLFNLDQPAPALHFGDLAASWRAVPRSFENFDLFVNAMEEGGEVKLECQFNTDLFDGATLERWLSAYTALLGEVVRDTSVTVAKLLPEMTPRIAAAAAPRPRQSERRTFAAPQGPTQQLLAEIWREALGVERVGAHDNFFELGGHSLLASQVIARINRERGVTLFLRHLFEAPTVAQLAALLDKSAAVTAPHIPPREARGSAPLSLMQERLSFLERLDPNQVDHNLPVAWRLRGTLDAVALERALGEIVRRHEPLRTTIRWEGEAAVQHVAAAGRYALPRLDLRRHPVQDREVELTRLLDEEGNKPFDLAQGPLFR